MHIHTTSGPDEPNLPLPTIGDARHGWGLPVDRLHQLLQAEPAVWEYNDAGKMESSDFYAVIYCNRVYGYCQSWQYDQEGVMKQMDLFVPLQEKRLINAFLAGSTLSDDHYIYMQQAANSANEATVVSVYEDAIDSVALLNVQYHPVRWADGEPYVSLPSDSEPSMLPLPTISQARYGWNLPAAELHQLLADETVWQPIPQDDYEDGAYTITYRHRGHNYCQCWDYNLDGQMYQVRFLILPGDQWLVGAFLIGATPIADDEYLYFEEANEYPGEERLHMWQREHEGMTHLTIKFLPATPSI